MVGFNNYISTNDECCTCCVGLPIYHKGGCLLTQCDMTTLLMACYDTGSWLQDSFDRGRLCQLQNCVVTDKDLCGRNVLLLARTLAT